MIFGAKKDIKMNMQHFLSISGTLQIITSKTVLGNHNAPSLVSYFRAVLQATWVGFGGYKIWPHVGDPF